MAAAQQLECFSKNENKLIPKKGTILTIGWCCLPVRVALGTQDQYSL
jgi:hypothetical protein